MKVSIIVCTYNRCENIEGMLQSLVAQDFPASDYEVIVVDNNSTDRTKDLVYDFIRLQGRDRVRVRYVFEEKNGLSHARNRGVLEAKGKVVAFIDDDAIATKEWIRELLSSYRDERIACVGGKALLEWPEGFVRPEWLDRKLENFLSGFNPGVEKEIEATRISHIPYGVNISFRRGLLLENPFRTQLGRTDKGLYGGEETELCLKLRQRGRKIIYNPRAVVYHLVPESRISKDYFLRRALDWGISRVIVDNSGKEGAWKVQHLLSYLLRFFVYCVRYFMYAAIGREGRAFNSYIRLRSYWVSIQYCFTKYEDSN